MFNKGDAVLYGSNGVCHVVGTDIQDLYGDMIEYLVLKPVCDTNSTVFVPIKNQNLMSRIIPVLSEKQVYEFIDDIPNEETIWIDDEKQRKQFYQSIISQYDRKKLVRIIKTLYLHKISQQQKGRKLHQADEQLLRQAEKLLYSEFSVVLNIPHDEILPLITKQIEKTPDCL